VGPELITLEDLKTALEITDDTEDDALEAAITLHSQMIEEYYGTRLGFANAVETFTFDLFENSRRGSALVLSLYPVVSVDSVLVDGSAVEYTIDKIKGMLRIVGGCGFWSGTVVVTYSGGYDLPDGAPATLQSAIIESIRLERLAADRGDTGISSVQHGETRVSYFQDSSASSAGLPSSVTDLLRQFRARQQTF